MTAMTDDRKNANAPPDYSHSAIGSSNFLHAGAAPTTGSEFGDAGDDAMEVEDAEVPPPDGGWGWVIVVGAGIHSMLQGLMVQTFGLLYLQFRYRYKASAVDAVWPCALNQLMQGTLGPLAAWLVQKYSSRTVTAVGTVFITVGILSTGFAPNLGVVYITYGILPGIGFCLTHTASFLHVGKYFEKRKARALALTFVNHGLGALIFAPVVVLLEEEYDYKGLFIVLSAIFLNLFISAALYRPLEKPRKAGKPYGFQCGKPERSLEPLCVEEAGEKDAGLLNSAGSHPASAGPGLHCSALREKQLLRQTDEYCPSGGSPADSTVYPHADFYPVVVRRGEYSAPPRPAGDQRRGRGPLHMFAALLCEEYVALCLTIFSTFTATATATSFVPAYAVEVGLSIPQAAKLVSVLGVFFAIGTLLLGSLFDIPALRPYRLYFYNAFIFVSGLSVMAFPLTSTFLTLCVPTAVTSATTAVIYSQMLTVLTDLLGRRNVAAGFGVVRIAGALGALTGRMVGGVLVDAVSSNSLPFLVFGSLPTVSSAVLFVALMRRKHRQSRKGVFETSKPQV